MGQEVTCPACGSGHPGDRRIVPGATGTGVRRCPGRWHGPSPLLSALADREQALEEALVLAERDAGRDHSLYACLCEHADIGIGSMKVAESPECPRCTPSGYALWATANGTEPEQRAARAYLGFLFGVQA
jgi:hypothetical protein